MPDAVHAAVQRALDAGTHVVLASGRAPHGMTAIAEQLDLRDPLTPDGRLWIVASNGSVLVRHPPTEIVHEETFDAAPAVHAVLARHPDALVAIEERGIGYRVSAPFPPGELGGELIVTQLEDLVSAPVSRVIIRDPQATAEDFVAMAAELGLHGTDYVVGWTAWLDLSPVGVSKASGLQYVAEQLGVAQADVLAIGDGRNDIEMLTLGRARRRDGPGGAGGPRRGRPRHRAGRRGRRRPRARPVVRLTVDRPRLGCRR